MVQGWCCDSLTHHDRQQMEIGQLLAKSLTSERRGNKQKLVHHGSNLGGGNACGVNLKLWTKLGIGMLQHLEARP